MREQVIAWLEDNVSPYRLQHVLGVERMCIELADLHQVSPQKAAVAGLMHDLAKFFPPPKLLAIARNEQLEIDSVCASNPDLLHAEVSAIVAREQFGVKDKEVLTAIGNHTLGSPQMSTLSCIVFVADALEANRGNNPKLEAMRCISRQDLYKGVKQTCDLSLKCLLDIHRLIHPRVILTRNWALSKTEKPLTAVTYNN